MQMEMLRQALAMQSLEQQPKAEGEGGTNTLEARVQQLEQMSMVSAIQGMVAVALREWTAVIATLSESLPRIAADTAVGVRSQLTEFLESVTCAYAACGVGCALLPAVLGRLTYGLVPGLDSFVIRGTSTVFGCLMMGKLLYEGTGACSRGLDRIFDEARKPSRRRHALRTAIVGTQVAIGVWWVSAIVRDRRVLREEVARLALENARLQQDADTRGQSLAAVRDQAVQLARLLGLGGDVSLPSPAPPSPPSAPAPSSFQWLALPWPRKTA